MSSPGCLTGMRREDSGNYSCEIRGPHSVLLANVTHQVFVRGRFLLPSLLRRGVSIIRNQVNNVEQNIIFLYVVYSAYMPRQFRPSVRLSRVYCTKTAERIIEILSPFDRPIILVFRHQGSLRKFDGFTPNGGAKYKG